MYVKSSRGSMFQSICFRRQTSDNTLPPLDLGFLAEAMLFYEKVHLIADYGIVEHLVRHCDPDLLFALIDEGFLSIRYLESMVSMYTENTGTRQEIYTPVTATPHSYKLQEAAPRIFQQAIGKSGKGRRLSNRFAQRILPIAEGEQLFAGIRADFADSKYVKEGIKRILQMSVPDYHLPPHFRFHLQPAGDRFTLDTNLEFISVGTELRLKTPLGLRPISPGLLLTSLFEVRRDLYFSSLYGGEIATQPLNATLIQMKCQDLLRTRQINQKIIDLFQDDVLKQGHAIREVINSGERTYKDVLQLLRRARRFRTWLHNQEPDLNLVSAYYKEVTRSTWVETLPAKTFRWAFLLSAGLALGIAAPLTNLAVSAGLNAADAFLLDRFVRGWRPNLFVEGTLKKFVQQIE